MANSWYDEGIKFSGGTLEQGIAKQIHELVDIQWKIKADKKNYYNWELTYNRVQLRIDRLLKEQEVAKILES